MWVFSGLFGLGGIGSTCVGILVDEQALSTRGLAILLAIAASIAAVGFVGMLLVSIVPLFFNRCPACRRRLMNAVAYRQWKCCPFCATPFDDPMPSASTPPLPGAGSHR